MPLDEPTGTPAGGDRERIVALRRRVHRDLPVAGPGVALAAFPADAPYHEIAAAFASGEVGVDAVQAATALAALCRDAGYEAHVLHFGDPARFVHAVTLVRTPGGALIQDAQLNRGFAQDLSEVLDGVATGVPPAAAADEDRRLLLIDDRGPADLLRWISAQAKQELAPIGHVRRFSNAWRLETLAALQPGAAEPLAGGDPAVALDRLMLHPLGVQSGARFHPAWDDMPVVGPWFARALARTPEPAPVQRRLDYAFALERRLALAGEQILSAESAGVVAAFRELAEIVGAAKDQAIAAQDHERALSEGLAAAQSALDEARREIQALETRLAADGAAAAAFRQMADQRLAERDRSLAEARALLQQASGELAAEKARGSAAEMARAVDIARLEGELRLNRHQLAAVERRETESAAENLRLRDELNQARGELEAARGELEAARGELEAARGALGSLEDQLRTVAQAGAVAERHQLERIAALEARHAAALEAAAAEAEELHGRAAELELALEQARGGEAQTAEAIRALQAAAADADKYRKRLALLAEFASVIRGAEPLADPFEALERLEIDHAALRAERDGLRAETARLRRRDQARLGARVERLMTGDAARRVR